MTLIENITIKRNFNTFNEFIQTPFTNIVSIPPFLGHARISDALEN